MDRVTMKVCFLYNHDAGHQVAHSIGIASALAQHHRDIRTVVAYGSPEIRAEIVKHGRRIANVRVIAWQESPDKPVAAGIGNFSL